MRYVLVGEGLSLLHLAGEGSKPRPADDRDPRPMLDPFQQEVCRPLRIVKTVPRKCKLIEVQLFNIFLNTVHYEQYPSHPKQLYSQSSLVQSTYIKIYIPHRLYKFFPCLELPYMLPTDLWQVNEASDL